MNDSATTTNALSDLRRTRRADIRDQVKRATRDSRYIYLLLEPDEDVVRYVGCCTDPAARYSAHIGNGSPAVRKWVESLAEQGQLPRMQVIGAVSSFGFWCERPASISFHAELIERAVINSFADKRHTGGCVFSVDLLNTK